MVLTSECLYFFTGYQGHNYVYICTAFCQGPMQSAVCSTNNQERHAEISSTIVWDSLWLAPDIKFYSLN